MQNNVGGEDTLATLVAIDQLLIGLHSYDNKGIHRDIPKYNFKTMLEQPEYFDGSVFNVGGDQRRETGESFQHAQLGLILDPDNMQEDGKELRFLLNDAASFHRDCNQVGNFDIDDSYQGKPEYSHDDQLICECCGFRKQEETVPTCIPADYIKKVGLPVLLFLSTIKHVAALLVLSLVVYSSYALTSNIINSGKINDGTVNSRLNGLSLASKLLDTSEPRAEEYLIQSWLGVALVLFNGLYFFFMTWRMRTLQLECEILKSVSDFSVLVEHLPAHIDRQRFQDILDWYYGTTLADVAEEKKRPFEIVTFNVAEPFYMNEKSLKDPLLERYKEQYNEQLDLFRGWVKERVDKQLKQFSIPKDDRQKQYIKFSVLKENMINKTHQLLTNISEAYKVKLNQKTTNTVFVTFRYQMAATLLLRKNRNDFSSKFRDLIKSIRRTQRLSHDDLEGTIISRAPQPEDVIWSNVGVSYCQLNTKKLITFTASFLILVASFGAIYGLSIWQDSNNENTVLSFVISIIILLVNVILEFIIRLLTIYEKNFSKTNFESSLAIKVITAQVINTILISFLCNYLIKQNIYGSGGLTQDVLFLSISGSLVAPLLNFINVGHLVSRVTLLFRDKPQNKLYYNQVKLNSYFEKGTVELGVEYVYVVKLLIFTSFYVSLQPIIPAIALVGLFIMYWAQKFTILQRSKRPANGSDILSNTMNQVIFLCPIFFSLGQLTWPVFIPGGSPKEAILPGMIAVGLSVLFFLVPLDTIFTCLIKQQELDQVYEEERVFFTSEYDRKNPATQQVAYASYMKYLKELRLKTLNKHDDLSFKIMNEIMKSERKKTLIESGRKKQFRDSPFDLSGMVQNLLNPQLENPMNPIALAQAQKSLAQEDTSFVGNILGAFLPSNPLDIMDVRSKRLLSVPVEEVQEEDVKSNASRDSQGTNYPKQVFNPMSYFQQALSSSLNSRYNPLTKPLSYNMQFHQNSLLPMIKKTESSLDHLNTHDQK